ncbi:MAG: hypothetical protein KDA45_10070 [Planctomycetales bacterium]|nr:hypothetical protein [Planctomycetales bacterium]
MRRPLLSLLWLAMGTVTAAAQEPAAVDFSQVARILNQYCAGCHNAEEAEGDFSVNSFASLQAGTPQGPVLVPRQPEKSKLLALLSGSQEPAMPPAEEPQPSAEDIALLRSWIAQGAAGPAVGSGLNEPFQPPLLTAAAQEHWYVGAACAVGKSRYATGGLQTVTLRQAENERQVWQNNELSGKVNSLRTSADGRWIVVGGGVAGLSGEVALLDADTGQLRQRFLGHRDAVYCASLSPDGQLLASGGYDHQVLLWDVQTGRQLGEFQGHNGAIYDLDFSPNSELLATASADQTVKLWHLARRIRLDTLGQAEGEQRCVRFSGDGRSLLAAGSDRQIRKWEILGGDQPTIQPLRIARYAHESDILQLAFLDSTRLISTSVDRTVKLWNAEDLSPLGTVAELSDVPVGICLWPASDLPLHVVQLNGRRQSLRLDALATGASPGHASDSANGATIQPADYLPHRPPHSYQEVEPNSPFRLATDVELPAIVEGTIAAAVDGNPDQDLYRFTAQHGIPWIFEVSAGSEASQLDSRIDILDAQGAAVLRTRLQATRESYFTFRGKDSDTSDDFRLHKWEDMELDEYLYANGEVNRLWLYPRGPDSGFKVYPGFGKRYAFFDTTPLAHALGEPVYIVRELPEGEQILPNGLPVFPIYYENDDDAARRLGKHSRLTFTAPADGTYFVRIRDARGFGGPDYDYHLTIRQPAPDFKLTLSPIELALPVGSGREWQVTAQRIDGLQAPIAIELNGLPPGLVATNPLIIEAGQEVALGCIYSLTAQPAGTDRPPASAEDHPAAEATEEADQELGPFEITLTARCEVNGQPLVRQLEQKLSLTLVQRTEVSLRLVDPQDAARELETLTIHPGETVAAKVIVDRNGATGRIGLGQADAGRNLPHGAFVDNIGLNGLLITEEQREREFVITAAAKVAPGRRQFHLRSDTEGNPTTRPVWLQVLPGKP